MRATGPLFQFDPGWLFIAAGLSICAAGVLLPAQADLRALEEQLSHLQAEEARAYQRLAAHADFIDQVERGEPAMIKRLAAAQLNLVPQGDTPLLLASHDASPVTGWIDSTLKLDMRPSRPEPASTLSRWTSGPSRLWLFGGGIMAVFTGVIISPGASRRLRVGDAVGIEGWDEPRVAETALPGENDADTDTNAACVDRGRIELWQDEPVHSAAVRACEANDDFETAPAGVIDPQQFTDAEAADAHTFASEIADTVDLEPHEPWMWSSNRTVIDDSRRDESEARSSREAAAGELILTAHELGGTNAFDSEGSDAPTADASWDGPPDADAEATATLIDAREGLGASDADDQLDERDLEAAGTGLLDAVEHAADGNDNVTIDVDLGEIAPAAMLAEPDAEQDQDAAVEVVGDEAAATVASAAVEVKDDAEALIAASDVQPEIVVEPLTPAPQEPAASAVSNDNAPPPGRRRPRRAKRSKDAEPTPDAATPIVEKSDAEELAEELDSTAIADATPDATENVDDDDDDSPAMSIPFLRNRRRSASRQRDAETNEDRPNKSRPRPRRRG